MSSGGPNFEVLAGLEDSYDQIQKMAIGGMAELYLGRQINLDRPVAIKRIRPELRTNRDLRERFRREAKSSANLLHQNLAHVYDFRTVGEDSYIIMEYIDGFDLAELIERCGPLPIDVATMVAVKILHGLAYVHTHAMIHRDIKPDNVRISTRGDVKIMDFGIAFDPGDSNLTMPGTLIGSPHYLSPEQIKGDKLDQRVDVFSFGITFYEMLTGKKPFFETESESVYNRITRGDYTQPEELRPEIPHFLSKIVENCLQVNPSKRPKSAEAVEATLSQFLATNYSLQMEPRIRKYLLQSHMLQGNPNLIEVGEKTSDAPLLRGRRARWNVGWRDRRKQKIALALFLLALIVAGVCFVRSKPTPGTVPVERQSSSVSSNVSSNVSSEPQTSHAPTAPASDEKPMPVPEKKAESDAPPSKPHRPMHRRPSRRSRTSSSRLPGRAL
jgi:serine/threonine protein kinase